MADIPIQISGVLFDKTARTQQAVYLIGHASIVGLTVGGGPIIPPDDVVQPPGGQPPHPAFPIWGPPGVDFPDKPGYPPTVGGGPILPDTPPDPPELPPGTPPNSVVKEAPASGGWGYYTDSSSSLYPAYRPASGGPKK